MGFDTRGSVQSMPPFTCSNIKNTRFFSGVFYLRFSLSANAEENLLIFRYLLQNLSLKKARDFFIKSVFS